MRNRRLDQDDAGAAELELVVGQLGAAGSDGSRRGFNKFGNAC